MSQFTTDQATTQQAKQIAAQRAVEYIEDGMRIGLGTGSTAALMVKALGTRVARERLHVSCVATSTATAELAKEVGLKVISLDEAKWLDLTIDGADEFDPNLNLIKGGGGALLHEKIVAMASDRMMVIADASKQVGKLGKYPLPIEIIPFGWETTKALLLQTLTHLDVRGQKVSRRMVGDDPFITEEGNFILDLKMRQMIDPSRLSFALNHVPGVVENGLFLDICDLIVIGHEDGSVELRDLKEGTTYRESREEEAPEIENIFVDMDAK